MALALDEFTRIAASVAGRTAEMLGVPAFVVDQGGVVVASSNEQEVGLTFNEQTHEGALPRRLPLHLGGQVGEIVVLETTETESIPDRLLHGLVELIVNQTAVVDQLPNKHEVKNKFIHDLMGGTFRDDAAIMREAQILGMDFAPPRVVILIDAADYIQPDGSGEDPAPSDARVRQRAELLIGTVVDFFELPNDTICAYIGEGEVAVLKASNRRNLQRWIEPGSTEDQTSASWANLVAVKRAGGALLNRIRADTGANISIGIGRHHPGLQGLAASYQDARAALSLGRRFQGHNRVHCLDGLGIAAFVGVSDERTKIDLATYLLSPLDHQADLLRTLEVFLSCDCRPLEAAESLAIHRNTLTYRLDKITSLIGLDPRHFDDAVQVRLALVLRSLPTEAPLRASAQ